MIRFNDWYADGTLLLYRAWRSLFFPRPSWFFDRAVTLLLWLVHLYLVAAVGRGFASSTTFGGRLGVLFGYLLVRFLFRWFAARVERAKDRAAHVGSVSSSVASQEVS